MLFFSSSMSIPPFASVADAMVTQVPRGRFAFLMTPFLDVDDRPYLKARANRAEKKARRAAIDADAAGRR